MPKIFGKEVSPIVLYAGVGLLGVLVYGIIVPANPTSAATTRRKKTTPKKETTGTFIKEDFEAKFAVLNEPVRNAFRPLVVKKSATTTAPVIAGPLQIPLNWVGNESGWAYTGYAEVDGIRQGLMENSGTGEAVFLRPGQRWKMLTVRSITAENIEISGPDGTSMKIPVVDPSAEQKVATNVVPPGGVAPVNPGAALSGPIGGAAAQQLPGGTPGAPGTNATELRVQPDNTNSDDGGGRRRRGRRGWGG